jgi:DNA-binding XRE family transcriptional regulator
LENGKESGVERKEFAGFRKMMKKTQREMEQLLGVSIKAIHSYEQGWRNFQNIYKGLVDTWQVYDATVTPPLLVDEGGRRR